MQPCICTRLQAIVHMYLHADLQPDCTASVQVTEVHPSPILHNHVCKPTRVWYSLQTRSGNQSRPPAQEGTPVHTDHTTPAGPAHTGPMHLADDPEPAFIRRLLIALTIAVLVVAVVANGAAYLGGVAFTQNVMNLTPITSYVFGGVIELALAVVAAATFIEAYRLQPTALFRTATWALSGVSGVFGALFEVMEYLSGHLTLSEGLSAAGWRLFAPFLAAGLWELVIHLFCGGRHRAHRAAEVRHGLLYAFFKAGEAEGLANGTWLAPLAARRARAAARAIAKHVPQAERDAQLASWLESAQYGEHVRVSVATIAARTAQRMRADLVTGAVAHAPEAAPALQVTHAHSRMQEVAQPVAPAPVQIEPAHEVHMQEVHMQGDYEVRAAQLVEREDASIRADLRAQTPPSFPPAPRPSISARHEVVRALLQANRSATGEAVHRALLAAGHDVKLRTAYNDRDAVLAGMA